MSTALEPELLLEVELELELVFELLLPHAATARLAIATPQAVSPVRNLILLLSYPNWDLNPGTLVPISDGSTPTPPL
jgi:hypothetical protein